MSRQSISRALVVGCPGAGKSTFARALRDKLNLPLVHLDMMWHLPDGNHVERDVFDVHLAEMLARERWIIDGNYLRTLKRRLERADTVFFLDLPVEECLAGAAARIGSPREDLPWQEDELDPEFTAYIKRFPEEQAPLLRSLLDNRPAGVELFTFHSHVEADHYLADL